MRKRRIFNGFIMGVCVYGTVIVMLYVWCLKDLSQLCERVFGWPEGKRGGCFRGWVFLHVWALGSPYSGVAWGKGHRLISHRASSVSCIYSFINGQASGIACPTPPYTSLPWEKKPNRSPSDEHRPLTQIEKALPSRQWYCHFC